MGHAETGLHSTGVSVSCQSPGLLPGHPGSGFPINFQRISWKFFQRDGTKIEDIENEVDRVIIDNARLSRNVKIYLSHRHTGEKLGSMGGHFDIGPSAVCQTAKRFAQRIKDDKKIGKVIQKIEVNLSKVQV